MRPKIHHPALLELSQIVISNPNERKVNERIKSDVCANRFYEHIEDQNAAISEYLDK
jgi:hypothetical protein